MKTYDKVYALVKKIPKGKVSTYRHIGQILSLNPRVVGWALNRLAKTELNEYKVPWQRVINSKGGISTNKLNNIPLDLQKKLLEIEGIEFNSKNQVNLKKYLCELK